MVADDPAVRSDSRYSDSLRGAFDIPPSPESARRIRPMNTTTTAVTTTGPGRFDSLLARDRLWVLAGILGMTALSWLYLLWTAAGMETMRMADVMLTAQSAHWTVVDFLLMFLMWRS